MIKIISGSCNKLNNTCCKMKNRCTMFWNLSKIVSQNNLTSSSHHCFLRRFLNVVDWSNSMSWIENIYCFPSAANGITQKLPFLKMINNVKYRGRNTSKARFSFSPFFHNIVTTTLSNNLSFDYKAAAIQFNFGMLTRKLKSREREGKSWKI